VENNIFCYVEECEKIYEFVFFLFFIPRRLNFMCRRFGTLCSVFICGVSRIFLLTPPMKTEQTECSETSVYKIQAPGNNPKERIQYSEHGESLKSRIYEIITNFGKSLSVYCLDNYYIGLVEIRTLC